MLEFRTRQSKRTSWTAFALRAFAVLGIVILGTNCSAAEPSPNVGKRPWATILGVTTTREPSDATLLGPLEDDPPAANNLPSGPVLLKPIPIQDDEPAIAPTPTRTLPSAPQPRTTTRKIGSHSAQSQNSEPRLIAPPMPGPVAAQSVALSAARYWIASTRCCTQKAHKCGIACRFVCHRATDNCQLQPACLEEMLGSLIPGVPTCLFVHGSYTRIEDVAEDAELTFRWVRCASPQAPLNFIYFTWPSEGQCTLLPGNPFLTPAPCVDMAILGRRSELNGFYLADLVGALPLQSPVCLLGHSLGTRTIASALHLLGGGTVRDQARWNPVDSGQRIRAVFAGAAIEHDWLNPGDRYGCALRRTECLLNLRNKKDIALFLFPLRHPFSSRALARAGFTRKDRCKLGEHNGQVSELDVTPWLKHHHSWPEYIRRPEVAAAIAPYVYFEQYGGEVVPLAEPVSEYAP